MALPLHSLLQAPARLAAPTEVTITHIGSPKPVLPPGDVLVTGHGVPRLCPQGSSHCPQPVCAPGAVPVPCHTDPQPTGPLLWGHRSLVAEATSSQGHTKAPGTRGVPWSRSHPHCCPQVGKKVMPGSLEVGRPWEETGICPCKFGTCAHCRDCSAGIVLMLHGLGGAGAP